LDEWLVQLSVSQTVRGCACAPEKYRERKVVVPTSSASKRYDSFADRDWAAVILAFRRKAMKARIVLVAAALLIAASQPCTAQISIDMNQISCGRWLGSSPDERNFIRFWMSGYYNAAGNSNVLNYDGLQRNTAKITAYCNNNKSKMLPTAIHAIGLW
jgi:hypothetical protein